MGSRALDLREPEFVEFMGEKCLVPAQGDSVNLSTKIYLTVFSLVPSQVGSWSLVKKAT